MLKKTRKKRLDPNISQTKNNLIRSSIVPRDLLDWSRLHNTKCVSLPTRIIKEVTKPSFQSWLPNPSFSFQLTTIYPLIFSYRVTLNKLRWMDQHRKHLECYVSLLLWNNEFITKSSYGWIWHIFRSFRAF